MKKTLLLFSLFTSVFFLIFIGQISQSLEEEISENSKELIQKISGEQGWGVVAVDPLTNKVYVSNHRSGTITVLDGSNNSILGTIEIGEKPYGLGLNTQTKMLYVAREFDDKLVVVDGSSHNIVTEIDLERPYDIAVNSQTNKIYVTSDDVHFLSVIDGSTNQIEETFKIQNPCGIAVNEVTNMIYVTSESENKVHVFDGNSMEEVTQIDVGKSPRGIGINPLTNSIYITNQASNTISVIDGSTNQIVDTIEVEDVPRRVVVMPSTNTIYVANQFSNSLSVIDGYTNSVKDSIEVYRPFELTIDTKNGKIYSSYFQNDNLSIIDIPRSETPFEFTSELKNKCITNLGDGTIFVSSDKNQYERGETIQIWGCVSDISYSKGLNIQLIDPDGAIAKSNSLVPDIDGSFFINYLIDEKFGKDGEYSIMAEFGEYSSEKTFTVPEFGFLGVAIFALTTGFAILLFKKITIITG